MGHGRLTIPQHCNRKPTICPFLRVIELEVISEKNEDWWLGRAREKEGLFPSNYVEKAESAAPATAPVATVTAVKGKPYRPFRAVLDGRTPAERCWCILGRFTASVGTR